MAGTFTKYYSHYVFSTKHRKSLIKPHMEQRLISFIGGVGRKYKYKIFACGGTQNHIHILAGLPAATSPSKAIQVLKSTSSKWMNDTLFPNRGFAWQSGYGGFGIDEKNLERVIFYIQNQKHHHKEMTYKEEFLKLLKRYRIEYNEKYVWD